MSVGSDRPLPPSPVLELEAIDAGVVRCEGLDGDNWPNTWAGDGWLYAAYGDGWGCRPLAPATKRNTGLVRLRGTPSAWEAQEVPCPWFGAGAQAPNLKGCGLLAAGGTLYHFLRYQVDGAPGAGRRQVASKLIVSRDGGRTWSGGDYGPDAGAMGWFFAEPDRAFHSPTFLQAGRDYRDAPDGFVYVYSPGEDRRRANDRLDLARVPLSDVADRRAYTFFAGPDGTGGARWTADIARRQPVLRLPGQVSCGDALFLPGLDRYLLATCGGVEGRASRLLLLDAPCPWGPWTLCAAVAPWGTGASGDARYDPRLPSCWIERAGRSLAFTLVFSDRRPADKCNWQALRLRMKPSPAGRAGSGGAPAPARLEEAVMPRGTVALHVERDGEVLAQAFAPDWHAGRPHYTASLAKLLVGGLALMAAVGAHRIRLDDDAWRHIPAWADDPLRRRITVRHLATHSSGIEDAEEAGLPHTALPGWKGAFWRRDPDPFRIARDQAPVLFAPGSRWHYSNPGFAMLGYCLTAALRGSATPDLRTLLAEGVFGPIGVAPSDWQIGYNGPSDVAGLRLYATWGGARFSPRAVAAAGRLLLDEGRWNGRPVLKPACVRGFLSDRGAPLPDDPDAPRFLPGIYANSDGMWPEAPPDTLVGAGAGHQALIVVPSLRLVAVRMGESLDGGALPFWTALRRHLLGPLMAASGR